MMYWHMALEIFLMAGTVALFIAILIVASELHRRNKEGYGED